MTAKRGWLTPALLALPVLVFFASLGLGAYPISPGQLIRALLSPFFPSLKAGLPDAAVGIIFGIRLPRLLLAMVAGAGLGISGASLQALFKNPLVNEYILGISSGSAFGASLSLVLLGASVPPQLSAFVFAVAAVLLVLAMARSSDAPVVTLLLTGVIVSAFFSALLSLVEFFASPYALQSLFYWLMGNLALAGWDQLAISLPLMAAGIAGLVLMRWRLNILSLSEEEGRALGISVRRDKVLVVALATLITAAATSVAGIIGWIGLIVPHLVRMMTGPDNRRVVPLSAALGAAFLMMADDLARTLAVSFEVPVGIFTSLIGIPVFVFLLRRSRKVWS
jgi:iron complex transport system permease protein